MCGASKGLTQRAIRLCRAVGERLAREPLVRIVSGGTKKRSRSVEGDFAADWWIVSAAEARLRPSILQERIVTLVEDDQNEQTRFRKGAEERARGKTSEARRIAFVRDLDALIAIGGGPGTDQELALAVEHHVSVLPVPIVDGAAKDYWSAYRPELIPALRITEKRARRWETFLSTSDSKVEVIANDMLDALLGSLPRRCFVMMPYHEDFDALFDFVIAPAVQAAGDEAIRVDRVGTPGDVRKQIEDGIANSEYVIAVLDNLRHNVLYELGMAHGLGKTTILLNRKGATGDDGTIPFDISTQQRLQYSTVDAKLPSRLKAVIQSMPTRRPSAATGYPTRLRR